MFLRPFRLRKKSSDDGRQSRFQRSASPAYSANLSPSRSSVSSQEDGGSGSTLSPPVTLSELNLQGTADRSRDRSTTSHESNAGPLGLNVLYAPAGGHKADIVFVHGLGGASRKTWTLNDDPELFWPLRFLPNETEICQTRILTFGYNANFRAAGKVSSSVLDFAKDLLFNLRHAKSEQGEGLNIGDAPLIFVAHSMGGLVVKEAYMQGQNDPEYELIVKAVSAIVFLSTPHRGTNLAELLDRILRSTIFIGSKRYVSELAQNSFTLQKLNEQFRHIAPRLDIVSFYENQTTSLGLKSTRLTILEKDSSVLGYPGEVSKALDADHHGVCKFESPTDARYIAVRNALQSLVAKIISTERPGRPSNRKQFSFDLRTLLAITELPDIDYSFFRDQWTPGTNAWILTEMKYLEWLHAREAPSSLLWLYGGAAAGKSVLSSFIINNIVEQDLSCQYFFFRFGDANKRALSTLLRSIAYQIARFDPDFMQKILELSYEAIDFETADPRTIWERVFKVTLFRVKGMRPLYWIIDGVDEADDPRALIKLLSDIASSFVPIRVLLVGRTSPDTTAMFQKAPHILNPTLVSIEGHMNDFCDYIRQELSVSGTAEFKEIIMQRMVREARNNFLWVRLAVERLNLCHTQEDVEAAFQELPVGMEALYDRMASSIASKPSGTEKTLASNILQCVTCSFRELTVSELSEALHRQVSGMLDFQRSAVDFCGGFLVIDNNGNVAMIHQTAREYLTQVIDRPFQINKEAGHKQMFLSCMQTLMTHGLRAKVKGSKKLAFPDYAAQMWASHLMLTPRGDGQVAEVLRKFLTGNWVLTWIHILASTKQLRTLIQASKHLSRYSSKQTEYSAARNDEGSFILEQELFESWAEDFVKIAGKFGMILRRNPESIYKSIPPFCPRNSAIYQHFGNLKDLSLTVSGLSNDNWDDSLARMSLGFGTFASSILAAGSQIAILGSPGVVVLFEPSVFEEASVSPIKHGERVYRIEMNDSGTVLVTYGYLTTKIWDTSTGKCKLSINNLKSRPRPLAMLLTNNSNTLLVGTDDKQVRSLDLTQSSPSWQLVAGLEEAELEGHFLNASSHMALSKDGSLIAVAYRGHPLSAWEVDGPVHIAHCWRKREQISRGEVIEAIWHPHNAEIFGLYIEGVVFKWRPYQDEIDEITTGASRLSMSRDGNLFATGNVRGIVKVYTTADLALLYSLASEDTVLALAFSPDLRRFYDIRGYYANAWEPNALMRYAEQRSRIAEAGSEIASVAETSAASMSLSGRVDSVTTIAASPLGRLYCCGTETGAVRLYDTKQGWLGEIHKSKSFLSIEQMAWSDNGRFLCFSDSSSKVMILGVNPTAAASNDMTEVKARMPMKNIIKGPLVQLLFHFNSSQLIIRSASAICTVSLTSFEVIKSSEFRLADYKCINHPQDPSLIIGVDPTHLRVFDWDLAQHQVYKLRYPHYQRKPSTGTEDLVDSGAVNRVLVTQDKKNLLIQISPSCQQNSKETIFLYFETSNCSSSTSKLTAETEGIEFNEREVVAEITPFILPYNFTSQIAYPLAFLSHNALVFLSRAFSVCSWKIPTHFAPVLETPSPTVYDDATAIKAFEKGVPQLRAIGPSPPPPPPYEGTPRLGDDGALARSDGRGGDRKVLVVEEEVFKPMFSLPGDWISRECLELCGIWTVERSLLCPRNGEVGVVRCSALV